jgi:hypothetical protein
VIIRSLPDIAHVGFFFFVHSAAGKRGGSKAMPLIKLPRACIALERSQFKTRDRKHGDLEERGAAPQPPEWRGDIEMVQFRVAAR